MKDNKLSDLSPRQLDIRSQLRRRIEELADEEYRKFHSKLVPGKDHILGVRVPKLRALAQEIAKRGLALPCSSGSGSPDGSWQECLDALPKTHRGESYEEVLLKGLIVGYAKMPFDQLLERTADFVPLIDNWAICDIFCGTLKAVQKHREETWSFLWAYLAAGIDEGHNPSDPETEYSIRFAVVMLLSHFITEDYIHPLLEVLDTLSHDGYYVKMAVAWALSICFIKFPKETMTLYRENHLDNFTYNKALQKTIESFRVDGETKDLLRSMKRK